MQRGVNARGQLVPEEEGRKDVFTYISKRGGSERTWQRTWQRARGNAHVASWYILESEEVCIWVLLFWVVWV